MNQEKKMIMLLLSLAVCAFSIPTEMLSPAYLTSVNAANGIITHADLNDDGVEELLVARTYGEVQIVYSDYGKRTFDLTESGIYSIRSLATGDADGDGTTDILVAGTPFGEYINTLVVIWAPGAQSGHDSSVVSTEYLRAQSACFIDIDRDGDEDIIAVMDISNNEVALVLFEYTQNRNWTVTELGSLPAGSGYWVTAGYLDDDEYLDFAVGAQSLNVGQPDIVGYINQRNNTFSPFPILENQYSSAAVIADLNLDRYGDVYIGNKWLKNDGNQSFSVEGISGAGSKPAGAVDVGDINNDGYPDLMASDDIIDYYVHVWQSYGPGLWTRVYLDGTWENNNGVALMDADNDGFLDAVYINDDENKIYWSRNRGNFVFEPDTLRTFTGLEQFKVVDLDNDGDLDLVAIAKQANNQSRIQVYENMGYGLLADRFGRSSSNAGFTNLLEAGKMDGDALLDLVVLTSGVLRLYKQTDLNTFTVSVIEMNADDVKEILLVDFDQDGHTDVLARFFDTDRTLMWYKNDGTGSFTKSPLVTGINSPIVVFDYDQNGANDILTRHRSSAIKTLQLHQNDGSQQFTKRSILGTDVLAANGLNIQDIDGDGDPDILVASSDSGKVGWIENLGDTNSNGAWDWSIHTVFNGTSWDYANRHDLNLDGNPDLLLNHSIGGNLVWSANMGNNSYPLQNVMGENMQGNVVIADFNGDSWPDILGKSNDEIVWFKNRFGVEPARAPDETPTIIKALIQRDNSPHEKSELQSSSGVDIQFIGQQNTGSFLWYSPQAGHTTLELFDLQGKAIQHSTSQQGNYILVKANELGGVIFWKASSPFGNASGMFVPEQH